VLAGERNPAALTAGLDPEATEVVGLVLDAPRNTVTDSTSEPGSTGQGEEP
jgi:hypothetical protein